ncbi:unnamed protein product [Cuscuta epithymum]|uniref:Retrotransposon gag domain-containing protein n=1 Tax=Cuscuta epithymum TaxID=186058 RepID=A0AAV0CLZ8_9ASTE|nr:unnamed protein product [Cuscuta epithymum]
MVRTRAKMELRMDAIERRLSEVQSEFKEELRSAIDALSASMSASMAAMGEQFRSRARSRSPPQHRVRSPPQHHVRSSNSPTTSGGNRNPSPNHFRVQHHREPENYNRFTIQTGRKIDLPIFTGDSAYNWLVRMERYFRVNHIHEEEQVEAAVVAMEGRAINWFIWWEHQTERKNWESLKAAVIRRFQPELIQNPYGPMLSLRQTGTVRDYRDEFEMVIAPQINIDMEMLKGIFLNGLRAEIKADLKLHSSSTLNEIMDTAILIEDKNEAMYGRRNEEDRLTLKEKGPTIAKPQTWGDGFRAKIGSSGSNNNGKGAAESRDFNSWFERMEKKITDMQSSGIRKVAPQLSHEELQERSRKGLCFKCGEKWNKEHTCKLRHYKMMLVEDSDAEEETDSEEPEIPVEEVVLESKSMQLSRMSRERIPTLRAFTVKGLLKGNQGERQVDILIDCGSTHNFVSQKLITEMQLPFQQLGEFQVELGNGERVRNNGRCEKLQIKVQDVMIKQDFYVLDLGGSNLILGLEWLAQLGRVKFDFQKLTMEWKDGEHRRRWLGDAVQILPGGADDEHHKGKHPYETITSAVPQSARHNPDRYMPDTASDVINEAGLRKLIMKPDLKVDQFLVLGMEGFNGVLSAIRDASNSGLKWIEEFSLGSKVEEIVPDLVHWPLDTLKSECNGVTHGLRWRLGDGTQMQLLEVFNLSNIMQQDAKQSLSLLSLAMFFLAMEGVKLKVQIRKLGKQKAVKYWEGRGARMKVNMKIKADSYHPP